MSENGGDANIDITGLTGLHNPNESGFNSDGRNITGDIKIMTGAYSLNKNSVINEKIFDESFIRENQGYVDHD